MVMMAKHYTTRIDWREIQDKLAQLRMDTFSVLWQRLAESIWDAPGRKPDMWIIRRRVWTVCRFLWICWKAVCMAGARWREGTARI